CLSDHLTEKEWAAALADRPREVMDYALPCQFSKLSVPRPRVEVFAVICLQHRKHGLAHRPLVVEVIVDPGVVSLLQRGLLTMLDHWTRRFTTALLTQILPRIHLVREEFPQVSGVSPEDLQPDMTVV